MMKVTRAKKVFVGVALLITSGLAAGYGCPPVIDSIWMAGVSAAESAIGGAITSLYETVSSTRALNLQRVLSAIKVETKQISVSAEQQISADIATKKSEAKYLGELADRKAIFNITMDYSMPSGQGVDPCGELDRARSVAVAMGEANRDMQEKVIREIDAAPGRLTTDQAGLIRARMTTAKSLYCTAQEAAMGACSAVGTMAGKDVDAGNFFASYDVSSPQGQAKSALLNNMFGVPYQAIPKAMAGTVAGQGFLEAKRSEDAIGSVSRASMKSIQSWTESRGGQDSVLDALSKKVGTFSGGTNYAAWERGLLSQSERGLLVEYAKMAATELYMLHAEYQQQERIEANLAAWQALRARQLGTAGAQYAQTSAARVKVK